MTLASYPSTSPATRLDASLPFPEAGLTDGHAGDIEAYNSSGETT
jgi:hypothetical protein